MEAPYIITKLEAAEQQLRAAIRLFFQDGNLLPVQTLIAAAHEVLLRLSGGKSLLKDSEFIRPERKKEWVDLLNATPNFLKHAGKDHDKRIEFFPQTIKFWILDCVLMHEKVTKPHLRESTLFMLWFINQYPQDFKPGVFGTDPEAIAAIGDVKKSYILEMIEKTENLKND